MRRARPLALVVAAFAAVALALATACTRAEPEALPNVRLGMSPRDVRDRFAPGGEGSWQTSFPDPRAGDDTVLDWSSTSARVDRARFEFHLGMLVAIRAHLHERSTGELVAKTARTVTLRRPEGDGTEVTVLARDCPTHRDEAEALARRAR